MGILCRSEPGACGQSMASEECFTRQTGEFVFELLTRLGLKEGYLEDANGVKIDTEEGRKALRDSLLQKFHQEGCFICCIELVVEQV